MVISTVDAVKRTNGNGTTTVFNAPSVADASWLVVTLFDATGSSTVKVLGTDYTYSAATGQITTTGFTPQTGEVLVIERQTPLTQLSNFSALTELPAAVIEQGLDKLTRITQDLDARLDRALLVPADETEAPNVPELLETIATAEATAVSAAAAANAYATRAAFLAASIELTVNRAAFVHGGVLCEVIRQSGGPIAQTNGQTWKPADVAYLQHYGVIPSDTPAAATTDYTTQVQAAMTATRGELIFTGWVKITNSVNAPNGCVPVVPAGAPYGGFAIKSDFNLSATHVFRPGGSEPGSRGVRLGFDFEQPASPANRAALTQYPWAISLASPDVPRAWLEELRIARGWNGIDAQGNCGGARFGIVEIGCFNDELVIDGPLDFIHIDSWQSWPFGFSANATLTALYYDGVGTAAKLLAADGFVADKFSVFRRRVEVANPDATSILPYTINSLQLDGDGARLTLSAGRLLIGNLYSTKTPAPTVASVLVTGGTLNAGNVSFGGAESVQAQVTGGYARFGGGEMYSNALNRASAEVTGGVLCLDGILFRHAAGTRTNAQVRQSGTGVLRMENCAPGVFTPVSPMVSVATDVAGNFVDVRSMSPHTTSLPAGPVNGIYRLPRRAANATCAFVTPGTSSFTYGVRTVWWQFDGQFAPFVFRVVFTPTLGTGTGDLRITVAGLETAAQPTEIAVAQFTGVTLTGGRTSLALRYNTGGYFDLLELGNGVAPRVCDHTNFTTGVQVQLLTNGNLIVGVP